MDISIKPTTENPSDITLPDVEYVAYLQRDELTKAIIQLAQEIKALRLITK